MCFDGVGFEATQGSAFGFGNVREAIDRLKAERWFDMEVVVAFDDGTEVCVGGHCFDRPDEVTSGLALCRAQVEEWRKKREKRYRALGIG